MLRAGGRRVAAVARPPPPRLRRRGPAGAGVEACGCCQYPLAGRVRALASKADAAQQPQPQPPPGARVVARQVRTDQRGYKATLYYYADGAAAAPPAPAAAAAQGEEGEGEGAGAGRLKGTRYGKVAPPKDAVSLQAIAEDGLRALLPRGYPRSVQKGYADYVKLQMTASLCSSAIGVLSTQSLLYAMGLGAGSVPLAAALNWIIKDGIGQIGGIVFASVVNDRFDANPKRWKMVATISLDASCALELLAPLAPGYFLAIASLANVGKNVCFLSASASRAAIHNSFAKRENLADITAKAGSQFIVTSILGTGLGILLSSALGSAWTSLAPICATLSFVHISCNYLSLRHVCLNTLNAERMELLLAQYHATGRVPEPSEISPIERFMRPAIYDTVAPSAVASGLPTLRMGRSLEDVICASSAAVDGGGSSDQLPRLAAFFAQDMYILNARGNAADKTAVVDVLMKEGATVDDVLRAVVHAYYVRREAAALGWRAPPVPPFVERVAAALGRGSGGGGGRPQEPLDTWLVDVVEGTYARLHETRAGGGGGVVLSSVVEDVIRQLSQAGWLTDSVFFPHTQNRVALLLDGGDGEGGAQKGAYPAAGPK